MLRPRWFFLRLPRLLFERQKEHTAALVVGDYAPVIGERTALRGLDLQL